MMICGARFGSVPDLGDQTIGSFGRGGDLTDVPKKAATEGGSSKSRVTEKADERSAERCLWIRLWWYV